MPHYYNILNVYGKFATKFTPHFVGSKKMHPYQITFIKFLQLHSSVLVTQDYLITFTKWRCYLLKWKEYTIIVGQDTRNLVFCLRYHKLITCGVTYCLRTMGSSSPP